MDIHPIIVHVPVAFLAIYAVAEILSLIPKLRNSKTFFLIKMFLLFVGTFGALVALYTGDTARELGRAVINRKIVSVHELFADITTYVFVVLVVIYLLVTVNLFDDVQGYFKSKIIQYPKLQKIFNIKIKIGQFFTKYYFITILLAVAGLVAVSITGALGGALVFGTQTKDPFINVVVKMLGL